MLNSVTRRLGLLAVIGMHVGIGVLLALPFFSLIMIVTDMLFIRDDTYRRVIFVVAALRERQRSKGNSAGSPHQSASMTARAPRASAGPAPTARSAPGAPPRRPVAP
jgi:hypothetical protein